MVMEKYNIWKITTYFELTYDTFIIIVGIGQNDILEIKNANLMIDILLGLLPHAYVR
jgi:soluble P-type ATPase